MPEREWPNGDQRAQALHVISENQSGGIVAGNYYAAPVTDQERQQQIERLQMEVGDLADFPERNRGFTPETTLERHCMSPVALNLYGCLNRFYKSTIKSLPSIGDELNDFKIKYYNFSQYGKRLENDTINTIGGMVSGRLRPAWEIYFVYFMLRSSDLSIEAVQAGGNFLNYAITWEDSERVFGELSSLPNIGPAMHAQVGALADLLQQATELLDRARALDF